MDSHVLKFVSKGTTFPTKVGLLCHPNQLYGVSDDSPDHFKGNHTLIAKYGYKYQHQQTPQFQYPSQKHYLNILSSSNHEENQYTYPQKNINPLCFHRKKGKLSQFMDKNGWMSKVVKIMGHQRNSEARICSNRDRQLRISLLKPKGLYHNVVAPKTVDVNEYVLNRGKLMSERCSIRRKRNRTVGNQRPLVARSLHKSQLESLHVQNINYKTKKTTKEWMSANNKSYQTIEPTKVKAEDDSPETLDSWYQTTCHRKWKYEMKPQSRQSDSCRI